MRVIIGYKCAFLGVVTAPGAENPSRRAEIHAIYIDEAEYIVYILSFVV